MSTLKPAAEMATAGASLSPMRAPSIARRAPRCSPRKSSCDGISAESRKCAERCRRAAWPKIIAFLDAEGQNWASPTVFGRHDTLSPTSGCSGRSASGPARCAPHSSARWTSPLRTSSSAWRSRFWAARPSPGSWPSRASAAGRISTSIKLSATTLPGIIGLWPTAKKGRPCSCGSATVTRSACSGPRRAAPKPPIRDRTRIWRPIQRRYGPCSTGPGRTRDELVSQA